jgi:hypothetical protein
MSTNYPLQSADEWFHRVEALIKAGFWSWIDIIPDRDTDQAQS